MKPEAPVTNTFIFNCFIEAKLRSFQKTVVAEVQNIVGKKERCDMDDSYYLKSCWDDFLIYSNMAILNELNACFPISNSALLKVAPTHVCYTLVYY